MDQQAKSAFIIAQAAMLQVEIAMMQAANTERLDKGLPIAYGEHEFYDLYSRYSATLGYNEALGYLRDG